MKNFKPYLRYIALNNTFTNRIYTKAYDCRFLYVMEGTCKLCTEHENFILTPDTLAYYPCNMKYLPKAIDDSVKFITVNFDFSFEYSHIKSCLHPVAIDAFDNSQVILSYKNMENNLFEKPFVITHLPHIKEDLLRLVTLFEQDNPYTDDLCSSVLSTTIFSILYQMNKSSVMQPIVKQVEHYIAEHYSEELNNDLLAEELNYHSYYINTVFKRYTGKTIHKYLMEYRINRSCELLISTTMSINEIANSCGFVNQPHYSTCFKKINNISPLEYRKNFKLI